MAPLAQELKPATIKFAAFPVAILFRAIHSRERLAFFLSSISFVEPVLNRALARGHLCFIAP